MPEERKLVTVLFADIVGSTAIGSVHDPEVVRAAFARAFARMRDILVSHGGTVEKFIGDAVMAVFGAPVAHEDDALRALRAAFALRDAVAGLGSASPPRLDLRIGANSGEVVAGGGESGGFFVTGQPVNIAQRLQSAAEAGEILVGRLTRDLTTADLRYGESRIVSAKGVGEIEVWPALELVVERAVGIPSAPLVDREAEIRLLLEAHARAGREGRPLLVTVYGVAGVGKSRLAAELAQRLAPATVRRGRCVAYGEGVTFLPMQEMLRADAGIAAVDSAEGAATKLRDVVSTTFHDDANEADSVARRLAVLAGLANVATALADVPPESLAQELDWALRRYFERRAGAATLTLLFEDVQWAEPALLDLVEHLADWARAPLLLLCLARPELLTARPSWAAGRANASALPLGALGAEDTRRLVSSLLPEEPAERRDEIVGRSEGNPLYVEEFARRLVESGEAPSAVPATLHGIIAARIDAAPADIKGLLQRASVMGRVFWTDALNALGEDAGTMRQRLLDAARTDFIVEVGDRGPGGGWTYRFAHVLVRDVVYASLPKAERAGLHDRFARWLELAAGARRLEYTDIAAYHGEQAYLLAREVGLGDAPELGRRAFVRLLAAARAARDRADYHGTRALFQRAVTVGRASGVDRAELTEARGYAATARLRLEGTPEALAEVEATLADARALGPSKVLANLLLWTGGYALYRDPELARGLFDELVAMTRSLDDPVLLAASLRASSEPPALRGDLDAHHRILTEARSSLDAGRQPRMYARILIDLAENAVKRGAFSDGLRLLEEAAPGATDLVGRLLVHRWEALLWRATGHFQRALDAAERALATARELGSPLALVTATASLGAIRRERGDLERAQAALQEGLLAARPTTANLAFAALRCELARTALAHGDVRAARRYAEDAAGLVVTEVATLAETKATLALVLDAEHQAQAADDLFLQAIALLEPTGLATDLAQRRVERARSLLAAGRPGVARPLLEAAHSFYGDPLAAPRRASVEALLR